VIEASKGALKGCGGYCTDCCASSWSRSVCDACSGWWSGRMDAAPGDCEGQEDAAGWPPFGEAADRG